MPVRVLQRKRACENISRFRQRGISPGAAHTSDGRQDPFVAALQTLTATALANGNCSISTVARSLNTSPRTIQRRLRSLGLSYLQVLDDVRREQALAYLHDNELKSHQIATSLGYSHAGGFTRAFRRWTGMSPRQYRATIRRAAKVDPEGFRGA